MCLLIYMWGGCLHVDVTQVYEHEWGFRWMKGWMGRCMGGWTDMDGWVDGQMDRGMDGQTHRYVLLWSDC